MSRTARAALLILLAAYPISAATAQSTSPPPATIETTVPAPAEQPSAAPAAAEAQIRLDIGGADAPAAESLAADPGTLPRDLSPWGMFANADRVVQIVMVGLAFASVVTWTVLLAKSLEILGARLSARAALRRLEQARNLDEAATAFAQRRGAAAWLVTAALQETTLSADLVESGRIEGIKERIAARLARIESATGRRLMRGTGVLASIGATAPFVGLFGTVWGIMNAFIGISEAETTNLAVVAPGIAEALLATAFGLVAAIPAVVIYNVFARSISGYRASFGDASAAVFRLASRDLDRRLVLGIAKAAAE